MIAKIVANEKSDVNRGCVQRWPTFLLCIASILSAASITNGNATQRPVNICERIREIRLIPFHNDRGHDATYDAFLDAGDAAVPCLIRNVTNTRKIRDPRETLKSPDTTVGDVAYFVLIEITHLGFVELLPPKVQEKYKNQGVFAYYKYVQKKKHRIELQKRLFEWYRRKYGKDVPG